MSGPTERGGVPVLQVDDLTVRSGEVELLSQVSFEIASGERVGLIGESGSGKSLTALSVMGLLPEGLRASGSVRRDGQEGNLLATSERRLARMRGQQMAMVFQEPMTALNPTMRVGAQVAEVMRLHRTVPSRSAAAGRAVELLGQVGLPEPESMARSYPHQLSGGQRQRVVTSIALANDPDLLICDEPTTALDVTVQALVLDEIITGAQRRGAAVLFITHDLAVVATVCERVLVMYDGRIVEAGPVDEVLTRPKHDYTKKLLAASELTPLFDDGDDRPGDPAVAASEAPDPEPSAISLRGVQRHFRRSRTSLRRPGGLVRAVDDVTLEIAQGERWGIVGESGSGKSTLLRLIAGLDTPTAGEVAIDGRPIPPDGRGDLSWLRRSLQLVFQDPMSSLDPRMRVAEIVAEPLLAQRWGTRAEQADRVAELLSAVGLPQDAGRRFPHQFSGGQRQRISLARALAPGPQILLADEPVSALDVSVRAQVLDLINDVVERFDLTLVFVSHDLSVVRHVCERVAVMRAGQIVESAPTEQLFTDPQHPYTRQLLAAIPRLERALAGDDAADLAEQTKAALAEDPGA